MGNKQDLLDTIKKSAIILSKEYDSNIKLEINISKESKSAKVTVTEYNL